MGRPDEYMNGAALNDMNSAFLPFAHPGVPTGPNPIAGPQPSASAPHAASLFPFAGPRKNPPPASLIVQHSPTKSRVETQIPVKLYLHPLPENVKKLHLQRHTISKPKLLSKPPLPRSPDTLELYASLVCTSAMSDKAKFAKAWARALAQPRLLRDDTKALSGDPKAPSEEESSLNGGNVEICSGCITRERKRAGRKKSKKPEEDEMWNQDEKKRIIVFNTTEYKDWQPAPSSCEIRTSVDHGSIDQEKKETVELRGGTMMVDLPMRIACYCRHHHEKTGFQVIMTIKDHRDELVAQAISASVMITDDHKTHPAPVTVGHAGPYFDDSQQHPPNGGMLQRETLDTYGLPRNAHSATDLQGLQNSFHARFMSQNSSPFAMPQQASQSASASTTPHSLSRQASPSARMGPNAKRRKGSSGSVKVPENLKMTRLQTGSSNFPNVSNAMFTTSSPGLPSTSASTSPFNSVFQGLPERPIARHRPQRSAQISTGPSTPNTLDQDVFSFANRSQSLENLAALQQLQFSAPSSARASRAPSPTAFNQMPQIPHAPFQSNGQFNAMNGQLSATSPRRPPTIDRLVPSEGPKAGGIEVTCLGRGFYKGLEVKFGDATATRTNYWSDSCLICLLPPAARPGRVAVTLKQQFQMNGFPPVRYPSPPVSTNSAIFTYIDDEEEQLLKQAMVLLSQKQTGRARNAGDFARDILSRSSAGQNQWSGGSNQGSTQYRHAAAFQSFEDTFDTEAAALKCLDLIDLDDSPFPANLNLRRRNGQTILHLASSLGCQHLVAALIARGAYPDLPDRNGMTPMHMAVLNGQNQIVRRLRRAGGDPCLRSLAGFMPADMAPPITARNEILAKVKARPHPGPLGHSIRSLPGSSTSLASYMSPCSIRNPDPSWSSSDEYEDDDDDDPLSICSTPMRGAATPTKPLARSRRNSVTAKADLDTSQMQANFVFAAAMAAWRDHLAPQIQNLQPNVNWTLPNLPTLPPMPSVSDYQAYHLYRLVSSFVPNLSPFPGLAAPSSTDSTESMSRAFLGESSAPPAYEEIYPTASQSNFDTKMASAAQAAAEAVEDQKCAAAFDMPRQSGASIASKRPVSPHQSTSRPDLEQDDGAKPTPELTRVKRLRSDSRLFFIWVSSPMTHLV